MLPFPNSMTTGNGFQNLQSNTPNRPLGENPPLDMNKPVGGPQLRPLRMEQPNPNVGPENNNLQQAYLQEQKNVSLNYQQRPRPQPGGDTIRLPTGAPSENPARPNGFFQNSNNFQNSSGSVPQGQRIYPGQQQRFPIPQTPGRSPLNDANNAPPIIYPRDVSKPFSKQQMEALRAQNTKIQPNFQARPEPENSKKFENVPENPGQSLLRKPSILEVNLGLELNNNQKLGEPDIKLQSGIQPENISKFIHEKEIEHPNIQTPADISKLEQESLPKNTTQDLVNVETNEENNWNSRQEKSKDKKQKENSNDKKSDGGIASGLVSKNIKFFEENDTAKTPLTPKTAAVKKERTKTVSSDVVKGDLNKKVYENGVDETPMIHPNLRSIYQAPCKVAKIPHVKLKKSFIRPNQRKSKPWWWLSDDRAKKKHHPWRSSCSKSSLQNMSLTSYNHGYKKQKTEEFNPEEELLAFFKNSKSVGRFKRDGNLNSEKNPTKVVYKPIANGDIGTPKKTPSKLPAPSKKNPSLSSPTKTPLKSPGTPGAKSLPKTPETPTPPAPLIKKVPMNKIQVGAAPSPNLKAVKSKVGSLVNTTHKPGGGNVRIESHKIDFTGAQSRIAAKNDQYAPSGGDKKITQVKLQWEAKSKVGSLENSTYKPKGGDKKIESVKLDFKEKAKPKVGSKDNVKHVPGGGTVKIENQKLEFKAQSKVGSLDNVKHKPGGGDIKIFDDKTYLKQISGTSSEGRVSGTQSFGDLSVVREVEGKSAPGTPGPKTSVKIKKTTTINASGPTQTLKKVTEVMVMSQTPEKETNPGKSPSKQQVKLTYSKFSSLAENSDVGSFVEVVKVPAKDIAPVLKPSLSYKDAVGGPEAAINLYGSGTKSSGMDQANGNEKPAGFNLKESQKEIKNLKNSEQSTESSNLPDGNFKIDSGMSKFLQDEMAAHEKVEEMWKEMNSLGPNSQKNHHQQQPQEQALSSSNTHKLGANIQQNKAPVSSKFETLIEQSMFGSQVRPNFPSNQGTPNFVQPQSIYQPTAFTQSQQHSQIINQNRFLTPSTQQQQNINRYASSQQN